MKKYQFLYSATLIHRIIDLLVFKIVRCSFKTQDSKSNNG